MWNQLDLLLDRRTQEAEREFYGLIGLVSVRFARLEANLTNLLGAIIHPNDNLLTATLTENLNLSKTVELIKKIGRIRSIDDKQLQDLISMAHSIRQDRNAYVHGVWDIQVKENGQVSAHCSLRRISFKQTGSKKRWEWGFKAKTVTLDGLRRTALKVEELSKKVKEVVKEIEDDPDRFME